MIGHALSRNWKSVNDKRGKKQDARGKWPQLTLGAFNYYHESSQNLIDCILEDRDPVVNVEWGLHITEMMAGALVSSATGSKYEMTTTLSY
jgi:hypothetical protein